MAELAIHLTKAERRNDSIVAEQLALQERETELEQTRRVLSGEMAYRVLGVGVGADSVDAGCGVGAAFSGAAVAVECRWRFVL